MFLALKDRIDQGVYVAGAWLPAEREMAQEFGLDRSAVRRVLFQLEELGLIIRETGKRPWVRGSAHSPTSSDIAAPSGEARVAIESIGVILPQHPVYPASLAILHGINTALRSAERPFRLQVMDTHNPSQSQETSLEKQALESVIRDKIAGVVLWHMGGKETLPQLRELERRGIPVVFVDRYASGVSCDFVGGDSRGGIETAIEYLRRLGHRRIAHLTTDEQTTGVLERLAAYCEGMRAGNAAPSADWIFQVPHNNTTNIAPAYDHFFSLPEPPTAILAMNDSLAHYFIAECERRGKTVPNDISVVGFDDLEAHSPRPGLLTTLHQPFDKMGSRAAAMLVRRIDEPMAHREAKQHVILPIQLVERQTCCPLA